MGIDADLEGYQLPLHAQQESLDCLALGRASGGLQFIPGTAR